MEVCNKAKNRAVNFLTLKNLENWLAYKKCHGDGFAT